MCVWTSIMPGIAVSFEKSIPAAPAGTSAPMLLTRSPSTTIYAFVQVLPLPSIIRSKRMAVIESPAMAGREKTREASNAALRMEIRVTYPARRVVRWRPGALVLTRIQPKITFARIRTAPYSPHGETQRADDRSGGRAFDGRLWLWIRPVGLAAGCGDPGASGQPRGRIAGHAFRARGAGTRQHDATAAGRAAARTRHQSL